MGRFETGSNERNLLMLSMRFEGIFPPIPTPFVNGEVAHEALASNIAKWSKTGIRGIVVLGSNGETVYLSEAEKRKVIEISVAASPQEMLIIAGTGCESTRETIRLTNDCAQLGAHAALVLTPHYFAGEMSAEALIRYYTDVADAADIPILLYSVPKFTHLGIESGIVSELSKHPNIAGIKDSSGNVNLLGEIVNAVDKDFDVLVGAAGVLFAGLCLGCTGGVLALANVAPQESVAICDSVKKGNFDEARELQLKMIPVNKAVTATYGVSGLKAALDMLGYFGGDPRLPLLAVTEKEKQTLRAILEKAELLD
ncbi:MAG: dihydrodipicolinate synthase family protein [Desulfobacterales bacterium]